jgi:ATPase subunit of ABC transporter with duplicated ATPase domains
LVVHSAAGRNGVGKSTLLHLISGRHIEGIPPFLNIVHVEQECAGDARTALQTVIDADQERAWSATVSTSWRTIFLPFWLSISHPISIACGL